ncbi:MAG: type II secretion system protein N [Candidatus Endonucleobacter bathymodioli]|uniref:Type II secretion system protein N n=1 Tax=Candidatus Endonucleibacter bathymodioli TaxID=539814 RepID=A0AA90NKW6_9GAMM|nr:type II secretion system protein N [Candidatus Endonucleobacter bathymodioli]
MKTEVISSSIKWAKKHKRPLITVALCSTMLVMLGAQLYRIYDEIDRRGNIPVLDGTASSSISSEKKLKPSDFQLLFGFNERNDIPNATIDIPKTKLNLTLHGSLANLQQDKSESSAIIQGSNQEKLYRIGDNLPGGAILTEVHADHVILKRNGQLEILAFPDFTKGENGLSSVDVQENEQYLDVRTRSEHATQADSGSLEERMSKLREQLQQDN